jgi:hypothetical protein
LCINLLNQIPFFYQQVLSYEKTPTLCCTVGAFEGFLRSLEDLQNALETARLVVGSIIQGGIDKATTYSSRTLSVPAYLLSCGEWLFYKAA